MGLGVSSPRPERARVASPSHDDVSTSSSFSRSTGVSSSASVAELSWYSMRTPSMHSSAYVRACHGAMPTLGRCLPTGDMPFLSI